MQIIFQDPLASLDPRMTVGQIIARPLKTFEPGLGKAETDRRVIAAMQEVGLAPEMVRRYPHEFSGGQCQRIGIARAMILRPKLVVCDEPVSALDVSIQAQIINLLRRLQKENDLALLFISHNLSVVRHISHRVLVLYLGRVMEVAERDAFYARPLHPYSQALISADPGARSEGRSARAAASCCRATCRRRSIRRRAAASAPAARAPPSAATARSPRSSTTAPATSSPATMRAKGRVALVVVARHL